MPFFVILGCLVALNAWMTRRVQRAPGEYLGNKKMLLAGIWIIPFMGAFIARNQLRACVPGEVGAKEGEGSAAQPMSVEPAPQRLCAPGAADLELLPHIRSLNGFPVLNWDAVGEWSDTPDLKQQAVRAWLLHFRDALGAPFALHESECAYVLSSLEPNVVQAAAEYVAKTRGRVVRLLNNIADLPAGEKSVVLVFDDEESYYHYVAGYYAEQGEFAFSGGMFIDAGCPHFVTRRGDLTQIESVIAHELTHSAVAHLRLPLWLDEGIAVNTEHRVAGVQPSLHTPLEMRAKHLRFWGETQIQQFWSGESFQRTDDGNLLSYDLARILVENLAKDWPRFEAFATNASRDDAGAQSAQQHLGIDLGAYVCALLQREPSEAWSPAGG